MVHNNFFKSMTIFAVMILVFSQFSAVAAAKISFGGESDNNLWDLTLLYCKDGISITAQHTSLSVNPPPAPDPFPDFWLILGSSSIPVTVTTGVDPSARIGYGDGTSLVNGGAPFTVFFFFTALQSPGTPITAEIWRWDKGQQTANDSVTDDDFVEDCLIDAIPPAVSIIQQPDPITGSDSATFAFTGTDNFTSPESLTYLCWLDNGPWQSCVTPVTFTGLALGSHQIWVTAFDQSGNYDLSYAYYAWTISASTPTPTVTATATVTATPTLTGSPTATSTSTKTVTPSATLTATQTATVNPNVTSTPTATQTSTVSPNATFTPTATQTATVSPNVTSTPTATQTATGSPNITSTPTITATFSPTPTQTATSAPLTPTATQTAGVTTLTLRSVGAADGWILESTETSNKGGSFSAFAKTFQLGDDARNRQYRAILSFDTSSLPFGATITSATLRIKPSGKPVGSNPFTLLGGLRVDIRKGAFGFTTLEAADFQSVATAKRVGIFGSTPSLGWHKATLNATGRSNLNKLGVTQFRLYFTKDDNNDLGADFMKFFSGNSATGKPELIITYTVP